MRERLRFSDDACVAGPVGLRQETMRIALILGPQTSSSGEIGAAMFAGKRNVRSFGKETSGDLSVNHGYRVNDEAYVLLPIRLVATVDGRFEEALTPDVPSDAPIEEAIRWLKSSRRR